MAQLINVRLTRPDGCPLGFRLQGGKDFGTPLVIQKVNGGSPAEKAGLVAGDSVIRVNNTDVYNLRHKDAQDVIIQSGQNFDLTIQRGGSTWKPAVTPVGSLPSPGRSLSSVSPVTQTSLKTAPQPAMHIGSGYNNAAKPFSYMNGSGDTVKSIVNKQYNTPVGMYSEETIAETLSAQAEVLAGGVLGVNFKKNEKTYDAQKSEVYKMLQEADNEPEPEVSAQTPTIPAMSGLRHVSAPVTRPDAPVNNTGGLPPGQNICEECERLIIGVFVRIKDKNLHVECFKCSTCGSSLKNQGYYNLNGKLYCDIHAKMVARQNPPAPGLEPVTFPNKSASTISSALSQHTMPLPPLSNPIHPSAGNGLSPIMNQYETNGSSPNISLELSQDCVDAFTNIVSFNGDDEKSLLNPTTNLCANEKMVNNNNSHKDNVTHDGVNGSTTPCNNNHDLNINSNNLWINTNPFYQTNNVYKKVIPPHLGGNYKPMSNISGPKPFGAPMSPSMSSPSAMSPRAPISAPISPASTLSRPAQYQPPPPPSAAAPQSITDECKNTLQEQTSKKKVDPPPSGMTNNAIMRNLSKNAFNGIYEIGIQRKIKPMDHIANMANKIKDTIVLNHPLNNDKLPNGDVKSNNNSFVHSDANKINGNYSTLPPAFKVNSNGSIPPPPPPPKFNNGTTSSTGSSSPQSISQSSSPMTSLSGSGSLSPVNEKSSSRGSPDIPPKQITSELLSKMIKRDILINNGTDKHSPSPASAFKPQNYNGKKSDEIVVELSKHNFVNGKKNNQNFQQNLSSNGIKTDSQESLPSTQVNNIKTNHNNNFAHKVPVNGNKSEISQNIMNGNGFTESIQNHSTNEIKYSRGSMQNNPSKAKLNASNESLINNKPLNGKTESSSEISLNNHTNGLNHNHSTEHNGNNTSKIENGLDYNNCDAPVKLRNKKSNGKSEDSFGKRDSLLISRPLSTIASVDIVDGIYPVCTDCKKEITRGPFISALGRIWCPEHFICANNTCRRHLQDIGFVEENGQLYCEYCFEQYIAPACDKCHGKIKGDCLNAIGKHFHPECFNCAYCGKLFGNNPFFLEEGLPYCEADWNELFTTKCIACGFPVEAGDRWVEALNNNYHSQCFNCTMCKKNLEGQSFYAKGGRPFCKSHAR